MFNYYESTAPPTGHRHATIMSFNLGDIFCQMKTNRKHMNLLLFFTIYPKATP